MYDISSGDTRQSISRLKDIFVACTLSLESLFYLVIMYPEQEINIFDCNSSNMVKCLTDVTTFYDLNKIKTKLIYFEFLDQCIFLGY